jgi:DNA polymerase III subunit beta
MKLICNKEYFKKAILNSERITSKQNTLPILNNILLKGEPGGLKISATNLEIGINTKIGAKTEKEGKITIPAKIISGFLNNLSGENENITLETTGDGLKITSGSARVLIKGLSAEDFPLIPPKKAEFLFTLPIEILKNVLIKILPCVAFNEIRQELTGVNIFFTEGDIFFAATDSFRLAETKFKLKTENINQEIYPTFIKNTQSIIVPANTLVELMRVVSGESGLVVVTVEEGQIFFEINGIKMVSRLINGKYPEYKHIIPESFKTRVVGKKTLLQNAVKMSSIFTAGKTGEIFLEIEEKKKKIVFGAKSVEIGENISEVEAEVRGPAQKVVFNPRYFLDGLSAVSTINAGIFLNSEASPIAIKEIDEKSGEVMDGYIYIVMPIKN